MPGIMDAGSRVEYGPLDGIMEEEAPCRPINEYGKANGSFTRRQPLCSRLGLPYYHLRFFSVYGCGDHPWSIISTLVRDLRQNKKVSPERAGICGILCILRMRYRQYMNYTGRPVK